MATGRAAPARRGRDTGAVTAELALALPAVVAVLVAALLTLGAGITHLRCADAARQGARAAAIGAQPAEIRRTVEALAGQDASVTVERSGEWVVVRVERSVGPGRGWGVGGLTAVAEARAWREPSAAAGPVRAVPGPPVARTASSDVPSAAIDGVTV